MDSELKQSQVHADRQPWVWGLRGNGRNWIGEDLLEKSRFLMNSLPCLDEHMSVLIYQGKPSAFKSVSSWNSQSSEHHFLSPVEFPIREHKTQILCNYFNNNNNATFFYIDSLPSLFPPFQLLSSFYPSSRELAGTSRDLLGSWSAARALSLWPLPIASLLCGTMCHWGILYLFCRHFQFTSGCSSNPQRENHWCFEFWGNYILFIPTIGDWPVTTTQTWILWVSLGFSLMKLTQGVGRLTEGDASFPLRSFLPGAYPQVWRV
jgi:hypothetical protein